MCCPRERYRILASRKWLAGEEHGAYEHPDQIVTVADSRLGRLASRTVANEPHTYDHDAPGRLSEWSDGTTTATYKHDHAGRRMRMGGLTYCARAFIVLVRRGSHAARCRMACCGGTSEILRAAQDDKDQRLRRLPGHSKRQRRISAVSGGRALLR